MSDEEENSDDERQKVKEPMPPFKMRFSDMPDLQQEKAIRLCAKSCEGKKLDKDIAIQIQKGADEDEVLKDECTGWHVIVGKSLASAITYQTKWVIFFDLLGDYHKTFLLFKTQ